MTSMLLFAPALGQPTAYDICKSVCEAEFIFCLKEHNCSSEFPLRISKLCMEKRQECLQYCEDTFPRVGD